MSRCFKSGFVTIIGRPNVGKSTLMNQLIGQKIAITSSKAQTTRNRIQTVYTSEEGQIVFLDTPGINKAKNKLGDYMLMAAERTLNEVDLILWLVELSDDEISFFTCESCIFLFINTRTTRITDEKMTGNILLFCINVPVSE